MSKYKITREQLYKEVWSTPMIRLADKYGVSNVVLAKICSKHNIPRPSSGYWTRIQHGKEPEQIELPTSQENDIPIFIEDFNKKSKLIELQKTNDLDVKLPKSKIIVRDNLKGSHKLIRESHQELKEAQTSIYGTILPPEKSSLDIRVSPTELRRALLIMDALLKAVEQLGFPISKGPVVRVKNMDVRFRITEKVKIIKPAPDPKKTRYRFYEPKDYLPTGRLEILIVDATRIKGEPFRKCWRDGGKQKIERVLDQVIMNLQIEADRKIQYEKELVIWRAQWEQEREERRKEEKRREELKVKMEIERQKVSNLMQEAEDWAKSQKLRNYIKEKVQRYSNPLISDPDTSIMEWAKWANLQADRLDPLTTNPDLI